MYDGFHFDNFFDLPESSLPQHCDYYFNILAIEVAVPIGTLDELTGIQGLTEINDASRLTAARPIYMYIYEDEDVDEDDGWDIDATPHTVVEYNRDTNEFSWYDMLDFETERPWAIEPIDEDFDYDEWEDDDWYD